MAPPYDRMRRNTALACAPVSAAVLLGFLLLAPATASAQSIWIEGIAHCVEGESTTGTVNLNSKPPGSVTLTFEVADTTIATIPTDPVVITPDDWHPTNYRNFTIDCVDDDVLTPTTKILGSRKTRLTVTSSGPDGWDELEAGKEIRNYEDENRTATLTEGGTYDREFYVIFEDEADISITATSSDTDVITVAPATLTFMHQDGSANQKWVFTGVDDGVYRGEKTATVTFSRPAGWRYLSQDIDVTVTDNDTPALVLAPNPLNVPEDGSATYTVKLATEPTDSVTVAIAITGDPGTDLTLDETSLTFTTANWDTVQTVTVEANDDDNAESETATLTHTASGGLYDSATADLSVTVNDNDTPSLVITPESLSVDEGDEATYTVKLASEPTVAVTVAIAITGDADTDLTLDETSLTFTTSNWGTAQTVTVEAGDDADGLNDTATLTHNASGGDYDSISTTLGVTTLDNDGRGFDGGALSDGTLTVPEGGSSDHAIQLSTQPTDTVTVTISGHAGTDLMLDTTSFTFTTSNWDTAQTVTVSASVDPDAENDEVTLTLTGAGGDYEGETADLVVTITDNVSAGLVFSDTEFTVNESGSNTSHSYTVKLATEPSADVTVAITKPTDSDLTLTPSSGRPSPPPDLHHLELEATRGQRQTVTVTARRATQQLHADTQPTTVDRRHHPRPPRAEATTVTVRHRTHAHPHRRRLRLGHRHRHHRHQHPGPDVRPRHGYGGRGRQQQLHGRARHPADRHGHRRHQRTYKYRPDARRKLADLHHLELGHRADGDGGGRRGR